ncbi:Ni/Fe-hydrogenase cytochrome b subunit [candidate division KSB1 bacterium]|nr:Ni/Fe-hydrogenase cytochrome b subunit [candidate division KSB1 bacterium]
MSHSLELSAPIENKYLTTGVKILIAIFGVGMAFGLYRFLFGLGSVTHLNHQYPLGLWIGVDVASGVALAAGGFTSAALIHIFYKEDYHIFGRPAHLTAMLGYTFVVIGLLFDLGRWYNVWHPAIPTMWQGNSVLFEVGICVMIYLTVLYIEFLPIVAERFIGHSPKWIDGILRFLDRILGKIMWVFIILGVVLSCLHQSSLGNLLVIAPYKMHPLWYTPVLPMLFLMSAIAVGFPMVLFEYYLAAKSFNHPIDMQKMGKLARLVPVFVGLYFLMKIGDLTIRGAWGNLFDGSYQSIWFAVELIIGIILPIVLLLNQKVRNNPTLIFIASTLYIIFGVLLNRINVFLIAYRPPYKTHIYFPSIGEILVTCGLIAGLILVYRAFVTIFPVLPAHKNEHA